MTVTGLPSEVSRAPLTGTLDVTVCPRRGEQRCEESRLPEHPRIHWTFLCFPFGGSFVKMMLLITAVLGSGESLPDTWGKPD